MLSDYKDGPYLFLKKSQPLSGRIGQIQPHVGLTWPTMAGSGRNQRSHPTLPAVVAPALPRFPPPHRCRNPAVIASALTRWLSRCSCPCPSAITPAPFPPSLAMDTPPPRFPSAPLSPPLCDRDNRVEGERGGGASDVAGRVQLWQDGHCSGAGAIVARQRQ